MSSPILFLASLALTRLADAQITLTTIPQNTSAAIGVSNVISPSFAGMGIEPSNLYSFTGGKNTNTFSINLFANLANITGVPPHLRIGGNTEDNMIYNTSVTGYGLVTNPNPTGSGANPSDLYWYGPTYFEVLNRLPANTPITFGLNLAYDESDYIARIVEEASAAVAMLNGPTLVSFEVGNEPDLYLENGFRTGQWTGTNYTTQWQARCDAIYQQVLKPAGYPVNFFEPACTANTIGTTFQIDELDQRGIYDASADTGNTTFVAQWNQHDYFYYIGVSGYTLTLDYLMDISQTSAQFAAWIAQITQAHNDGYQYALREMASVGPIGQPGISDTFGATLWTLNFFLYTASLNVTGVQMHMTDNSYAAPWQPIENYNRGPYVRSTYYAWVAMDQLIGRACSTQVVNVPVYSPPQYYASRLTVYASYQQGALAAIVFMNTRLANATESNKPSIAFTISLPQYAGQTLYLATLTAAGADSTANTTFNGLSYEQSGDGTATSVGGDTETVVIGSDGSAVINVRDSQAVIANIGARLGTGAGATYDASACAKLASSTPIPSELYNVPAASSIPASALPSPSSSPGSVLAANPSSTDAGHSATSYATGLNGGAAATATGSTTTHRAAAVMPTAPPSAMLVAAALAAGGLVAGMA